MTAKEFEEYVLYFKETTISSRSIPMLEMEFKIRKLSDKEWLWVYNTAFHENRTKI